MVKWWSMEFPAESESHHSPSTTPTQWIARATAGLVVMLAIGAFILSFEALRDLAVTSGAVSPRQAWVFPFIIDGSIIVFSLSALRASLTGEDRKWYMLLVTVVTLASVGFNVAHAKGGTLACIMAAMPPLLLFGAFESLMRQLFTVVSKEIAPPNTVTVANGLATAKRRGEVQQLHASGMSRNAIARKMGVSAATIRRDLTVAA